MVSVPLVRKLLRGVTGDIEEDASTKSEAQLKSRFHSTSDEEIMLWRFNVHLE